MRRRIVRLRSALRFPARVVSQEETAIVLASRVVGVALAWEEVEDRRWNRRRDQLLTIGILAALTLAMVGALLAALVDVRFAALPAAIAGVSTVPRGVIPLLKRLVRSS